MGFFKQRHFSGRRTCVTSVHRWNSTEEEGGQGQQNRISRVGQGRPLQIDYCHLNHRPGGISVLWHCKTELGSGAYLGEYPTRLAQELEKLWLCLKLSECLAGWGSLGDVGPEK